MRAWVLCLAVLASGCALVGPGPEDLKMARAEYGLAHDAFKRGKYRPALEHIEKALEHDEQHADAAYLGAMVMLVFCIQDQDSPDCRYERAERFARTALEAEPGMRDAQNALGVILVHQGRPAEAIEVLEPLSTDMLYRSPEKAWGNLGWAYLEAGSLDAAVSALERAVAAQPSFCVGHYRLGLAYEKRGDLAAARQAFSRAVAIDEGGCDRLQQAFWARARVARELGEPRAARKNLEKCREVALSTKLGKKCAAQLARLE